MPKAQGTGQPDCWTRIAPSSTSALERVVCSSTRRMKLAVRGGVFGIGPACRSTCARPATSSSSRCGGLGRGSRPQFDLALKHLHFSGARGIDFKPEFGPQIDNRNAGRRDGKSAGRQRHSHGPRSAQWPVGSGVEVSIVSTAGPSSTIRAPQINRHFGYALFEVQLAFAFSRAVRLVDKDMFPQRHPQAVSVATNRPRSAASSAICCESSAVSGMQPCQAPSRSQHRRRPTGRRPLRPGIERRRGSQKSEQDRRGRWRHRLDRNGIYVGNQGGCRRKRRAGGSRGFPCIAWLASKRRRRPPGYADRRPASAQLLHLGLRQIAIQIANHQVAVSFSSADGSTGSVIHRALAAAN